MTRTCMERKVVVSLAQHRYMHIYMLIGRQAGRGIGAYAQIHACTCISAHTCAPGGLTTHTHAHTSLLFINYIYIY